MERFLSQENVAHTRLGHALKTSWDWVVRCWILCLTSGILLDCTKSRNKHTTTPQRCGCTEQYIVPYSLTVEEWLCVNIFILAEVLLRGCSDCFYLSCTPSGVFSEDFTHHSNIFLGFVVLMSPVYHHPLILKTNDVTPLTWT